MVNDRSKFAAALCALMDNPDSFSRQEWSEYLGVTQGAISQWLNDHSVPRPLKLHMIVSELRDCHGDTQLFSEFERVCNEPAWAVSPCAKHSWGSFATYMMRPRLEAFTAMVSTMSLAEQKAVFDLALEGLASARTQHINGGTASTLPVPGSRLDIPDLVRIFGGPKWSTITVIGEDPYELAMLPIEEAAPENNFTNFVSAQAKSAGPRVQLHYILSEFNHQQRRRLRQLTVSNQHRLKPTVWEDPKLVNRMLNVRCEPSLMPLLIVVFNSGQPGEFGYSWVHDEENVDYGVVLEGSHLESLARAIGELTDETKTSEEQILKPVGGMS